MKYLLLTDDELSLAAIDGGKFLKDDYVISMALELKEHRRRNILGCDWLDDGKIRVE